MSQPARLCSILDEDQRELDAALRRSADAQSSAEGEIVMQALPAMADEYADRLTALFHALSRRFTAVHRERLRALLVEKAEWAFRRSPNAVVRVRYRTDPAPAEGVTYEIQSSFVTSEAEYATWARTRPGSLFGERPDARAMRLVEELGGPGKVRCLDVGAGTGRNALPLARAGYEVEAIEPAPALASLLEEAARREGVAVDVHRGAFQDRSLPLRGRYDFVLLAQVCSHFRHARDDLRTALARVAELLEPGGVGLVNLFLASPKYAPERLARELSEAAWCTIFTRRELEAALDGLGLTLVSDEAEIAYERAHLPPEAWPPTPWYERWASGRDVFPLPEGEPPPPFELRWLALRRDHGAPAKVDMRGDATAAPGELRPSELRAAMIRATGLCVASRGHVVVPAVPSRSDSVAGSVTRVLASLSRSFSTVAERAAFHRAIADKAAEAFALSPAAKLRVRYETARGELPFKYAVDVVPPDGAPASAFASLSPHGEARVLEVARELGSPATTPCLVVAAGMGRNALALARAGHPVDAIETVPLLAEALESAAAASGSSIGVRRSSLLDRSVALPRRAYRLVVLSDAFARVPDQATLRRAFARVAELLAPGGAALASLFVAADGYRPTPLACEMGAHLGCPFVDRRELAALVAGLPLRIVGDVAKHAHERTHAEVDDASPLAAYASWATGRDLFALPEDATPPVELRWLTFLRA